VVTFTVWELWIARNTVVFSGETRIAMVVAQQALAAAVERWNVIECALEYP